MVNVEADLLAGSPQPPEEGNLVRVRDRFWVVESVVPSEARSSTNGADVQHNAVRLVPVDDKGSPELLTVFWEVEPGTEVRPQAALPDLADGLDDNDTFAAFLDAVRWGAVSSTDPSGFQAPFRAGIDIEDYQLVPLVKALDMPRVSLLIADDVGMGKTIEAGLIAEELVLRNQVRKILVVCPPSLCGKWQCEMRDRFGLGFEAAAALDAEADDGDTLEALEQEALALAATALPGPTIDDEQPLARLRARALPYGSPAKLLSDLSEHADRNWRRPDAKTRQLLDWIGQTCFPNGEWNNERVIVFTEYRATLNYLLEMLTADHPDRPAMRDRVAVFHGGIDQDERDRIISEFNYDPGVTPVRVLLATDAASEGIDLHGACHRLVHMEVPFNPNRMEQRNGRVDRHGQKSPHVDIFHFASPDSEDGSPGHDHSFLLRVACKVDEIREDLGRVAPVLAERIEARMLRAGSGSLDLEAVLATRRDQARADLEVLKRDFARQLGEVHRLFRDSIEEIELSPESLRRAVRVGLRISNQPELVPTVVERPAGLAEVFTVADLSGTWPETLIGLHDEVADKRRLLDDPSYITGADRRGLTLGENVAPLSASVSASLLAQYVSLGVAPGGLGDPGPLQYLLSSHHLEKLADVTRMDCPVEAAEGAGDHRTDLNGRHQRAEHLRRLVASPGGRLRMLRWIDDRAQAVIDWLDRHSRTP